METESFIEETRRAFDNAAGVYDRNYEGLYGIRRLRGIISSIYLKHFSISSPSLLELNCGTGTDAVFLGQHGFDVLATDLSPLMINETRRKVDAGHLSEKIQTRILDFNMLAELQEMRFDGAYSNMGGINCTPYLDDVAENLARLIQPQGFFIATVLTSFCLWETTAFLARAKMRQAFRRRVKGGCAAHLHGGIVQTFYYSPRRFARVFSPWFEVVSLTGLNIFTPPPNSPRAYEVVPWFMGVLENLEDRISHLFPFTSIGDHYVIVLRRKPA